MAEGRQGRSSLRDSRTVVATKIRCFVAIDVAEEVRQRLVAFAQDLAQSGADVRWVRPEGLHVTLKFLGPVAEAELPAICEAVQNVAGARSPWTIVVRDLAAFPSLRRPRVLWAGVRDDGQVSSLASALEEALERLGFAREDRPFTPHITLGRVNSLRGWEKLEERLKNNLASLWGESKVDKVIVYRSDLKPTGAVYTPLWTTFLKENRG